MLNKRQQLLAYAMKKHPKASITVLVKLAYLIDLVSIKNTNRQITDYKYIRYYFGPYDSKVVSDVQGMLEKGAIEAHLDFTPSGEEFVVYDLKEDFNLETSLNSKELKIIDEVLKNVQGYGAKALTEIAYKTKPMQKFGATLGGNEHLNEELDMYAK
jgi:uncharacterized phage-associated protein